MLGFAISFIEVQWERKLRDYVQFQSGKEMLVRQAIDYEWTPIKCGHCELIGEDDDCRKKNKVPGMGA